MQIAEPLTRLEIGFSPELRERWRAGSQPRAWFMEHPRLFDGSDLEIALSQPAAHFAEWLVAIELSVRGLHVLVEKWDSCAQHPRECHQARAILGDDGLKWFKTGAAGADLLVFDDEGLRFFVEVKLLPDDLREEQNVGFDVFDRMFCVPWLRIDARSGASSGLSDEQFQELNDVVSARVARRPQPALRGNPAIPQYPVGKLRPMRCHGSAREHPRHAVTQHLKEDEGSWRCESCRVLKTRATIVEIVDEIQRLKGLYWAAGGSRSRSSGISKASLPENVREIEREWKRYSRDQIELSWVV